MYLSKNFSPREYVSLPPPTLYLLPFKSKTSGSTADSWLEVACDYYFCVSTYREIVAAGCFLALFALAQVDTRVDMQSGNRNALWHQKLY